MPKKTTTTTTSTPDVPETTKTKEERIEELSAGLDAVKKELSGGTLVPNEAFAEFEAAFGKVLNDLVDANKAYLKIKAALGAKAHPDKPVNVYRYVDADDEEGFIPADVKDAELIARAKDADGEIEFGYAYKRGDKFVGFKAFAKPDGGPGEKY